MCSMDLNKPFLFLLDLRCCYGSLFCGDAKCAARQILLVRTIKAFPHIADASYGIIATLDMLIGEPHVLQNKRCRSVNM